jgi:hypothetical protein
MAGGADDVIDDGDDAVDVDTSRYDAAYCVGICKTFAQCLHRLSRALLNVVDSLRLLDARTHDFHSTLF